MTTEIAKTYWEKQKEYPFPFTKRRRLHELNYLVPRLEQVDGRCLLDLGCGDGSLLECLLRLTDFQEYYGYDLAEALLTHIDPRVTTQVYDLNHPTPLPLVDATIMAGVIQYLFDDQAVDQVLSQITSPVAWIRSTCTLQAENEPVERNGYASLYRTLPNTHGLLERHFEVCAVDRVYPDAIESPFGTKQFYFECRRRK